MLKFFRDWLKKLFDREAWVPLALIAIATVAMFAGMASFVEWSASCGGFAAVMTAGLHLKKKEARLSAG